MIFQCRFRLPFKLPIEDGNGIVSVRYFGDFKVTFVTEKEIVKVEDQNIENYYTVMDMNVAPTNDSISTLNEESLLRFIVMNCIHYINNFLDAFRATSHLNYFNNITIVDLPMVLKIRLDDKYFSYLTRLPELMGSDNKLAPEVLQQSIKLMLTWDRYPEIAIQERFLEAAKSSILSEEFSSAIIELQTSFEVFIRNTHRLILLHNNTPQKEIDRITQIQFRNVIEQHLAKHLKENLSFNKPGPINN